MLVQLVSWKLALGPEHNAELLLVLGALHHVMKKSPLRQFLSTQDSKVWCGDFGCLTARTCLFSSPLGPPWA